MTMVEDLHLFVLNNKAVRSIRDGLYNESIYLLTTALQSLIVYLEGQCNPAGQPDVGSVLDLNVEAVAPKMYGASDPRNERVFPLFASGLKVSCSNQEQLPYCTRADGLRIAAIILYNLALVNHLVGSGREDQQGFLIRALCHYELAGGLLIGQTRQSACDALLGLAIFNNKGHIYANFFEADGVNECLVWLRNILYASIPQKLLPEEHLVSFRLTVVLHLDRIAHLLVAPAA